jgi:hypothetical protein
MRTWNVTAVIVGLFLAGCTSPRYSGGPQLPANAKTVGGGLSIKWTAPATGTAILTEVDSGKLIKTQSLNVGDKFEFDPLAAENTQLLESMFGKPNRKGDQVLSPLPKHARIVLYFVPETTERP